ncbi:hypothetical protein LB577_01310 [Mesorhizobium sp. B283B1A]|uniref:hypothetical protein n=1 Tax=Mesorhizobium TaxID=68287 RepID=UPI001CD19178|nr:MULTISPECIES: hypothetical protein [Mesorhizobium]MCA0045602.1 hypothetical protein [Mesorhizobium sp. B283B1A]UQS63395.1 hypothetical protein M5D98_25180 [Mesorhizobium opportunistum]
MPARHLFNYKSHQPALYQEGQYLYSMGGQPKHWLDREYGYSCETQKPSLWVDGKYVYGLKADGTPLGTEPAFYYGD